MALADFNAFVKHGAGAKIPSLARTEDPLVVGGHLLSTERTVAPGARAGGCWGIGSRPVA
jgi:hypothetical protein